MENQEIKKIDENTISVVKTVPVQFSFTPEYLINQRLAILAQKEKDNIQRDLEIAEVDSYLAECKKLNVVLKPVEIIEEKIVEPEILPTEVIDKV